MSEEFEGALHEDHAEEVVVPVTAQDNYFIATREW